MCNLHKDINYINLIFYEYQKRSIMRNIIILTCLLLSLSLASNAQAQCLFGSIVEASREAEEKRLRAAPKLAETLIPKAKEQSNLGAFLIDQLTVQSEQETKKSNARKIRNEIKKIQKDLNKLDKGISEWQREDYDEKLDKTSDKFEKYLNKYSSIVVPEANRIAAAEAAEQEKVAAAKRAEQERVAAAKRAEQERVAAAKRAEQDKKDAYIAMCEGIVSDDPFAVFDTPDTENRLLLTAELGGNKIKLQANEDGCMWIEDPNDSSILPELIDASIFQQNPNNKSQYVYNGVRDASLILDFAKYQCLSQRKDGTRQKISCYNSSKVDVEVVVSAPSSSSSPTLNNSSTPSASLAQISCGNLYDEFQANEVRTIRNYKDKEVVITGTVTSIDADFNDNAIIVLGTGKNDFGISSCRLSPNKKNQDFAYNLEKGQSVRLRCNDINEMVGSPTAENCVKL